jgi:hypothetical protein
MSEIHYARTPDGVSLAYRVVGEGPIDLGSTERAAQLGDSDWRALVERREWRLYAVNGA